jgi:hypothetical protein
MSASVALGREVVWLIELEYGPYGPLFHDWLI